MRSNKGFTLIELLICIGIIAILASVVIVALNPARQFAAARCKALGKGEGMVSDSEFEACIQREHANPTDIGAKGTTHTNRW